MAINSAGVRTIRHGRLFLLDGAVTPLEITLDFENGELSGMPLKSRDIQHILVRGQTLQFFEADDQIMSWSISFYLNELVGDGSGSSDWTDLTQFQAMMGENFPSLTTDPTTTGEAAEPFLFDVRLRIYDPTDTSDTTYEDVEWGKCVVPTIDMTSGQPNHYTVAFLSRGNTSGRADVSYTSP